MSKPTIRFKGYTDDWEQRNIKEISKVFIGLVTSMTENYRDNGTLLIRNSDIKAGYFKFSENPIHLDEQFAEKNSSRRLQIGDVITVHTGDIGTSAVIGKKEEGSIGFATINTRPDKSVLDSNFLSTYFNTTTHKNWAIKMSTGDGRSNYNLYDFNRLIVPLPNIEEQQKIGQFFKQLDDTIALHQRKLELLKEQKKGFLQKMFPKNGQSVPEIRFAGFTGDWEQRKLETQFEKVNERNDGSFGREHWISVAKMYFQNPEKVQSNNIDTRTYVMRFGDIAFEGHPNKEFKFGRFVANDIGSGVVSELFPIYRHTKKYDNNYWKYAIQLENIMGPVFAKSITSSGNSSNKLDPKHFLRQKISIPKLEEQQKIGQFFKQLDDTIALHQRKLDKLQQMKQAFLQKMFV